MKGIASFHNSACVRLDVSIWTARAKLRREDLPNADDLPPEALASMGSKRLFDPVKLRVFNTLKARAISLLDRHGVRFLGGWCIRQDLLPELDRGLNDIRTDFMDALRSFLQDYEYDVDQWLQQFPDWRHILNPVIPSAGELNRRFSFSWQMYKIDPETTSSEGNNLMATIHGLADKALEEVLRMARETYDECFKDKEVVTKKAFRPVHTMLQKLDTLTYLHPNLLGLQAVLTQAVTMAELSPSDPNIVRNFQLFLLSLQAPAVVEKIISKFNDGVINSTDAFHALVSTVTAAKPEDTEQPPLSPASDKCGDAGAVQMGETHQSGCVSVEAASAGCETPNPVGAIFDMF